MSSFVTKSLPMSIHLISKANIFIANDLFNDLVREHKEEKENDEENIATKRADR